MDWGNLVNILPTEVLIIVYGIHLFDTQKDFSLRIYLFLFRPLAIQNHFNRVAYFMTWDGMHSPIREKNANALYDNPHVVNRDQI